MSTSHKIVQLILAILALVAPILLFVAAGRIIDLSSSPFDVICLIVTCTWAIPRLRGIYLRGIIVATKGGIKVSNEARMIGNGMLAFSHDLYIFSNRMKRFIRRWEYEETKEII